MIANNKRAYYDYFVLEKLTAGIELIGCEVKSLRANNASFLNAYVEITDGQAFVTGLHIKPYDHGNIWNTDPDRKRRLLLHKSEIKKLQALVSEKGITVVPLLLYFDKNHVKLEIGVCKGKKLYDKRNDLKQKDVKRDIERSLK